MKYIFLTFLLLGFFQATFAQTDSLKTNINDEGFEIIENYIQNNDIEGNFENNDIFEALEIFQRNPINLNKASYDQLEELQLLDASQISALIDYRIRQGKLISLYELQVIPGFDLTTIKEILPFVKVIGGLDDTQVPIGRMLSKGKNEIMARWVRVLEERKGFSPLTEGEEGSRYLGDPNKLFFRYKHFYENRMTYGFTAEKDAGEEFFKGSNKQGFDFYSAHFFLKDYSKRIKSLALGDYAVSFGQGLILFNGFARGKGAEVMSIRRSARPLRAYSSVGEALFMRGAGVTLGLNDNLDLTLFGSYRNRDANLLETVDVGGDVIIDEDIAIQFSSIQESGLHRTVNEIADENALRQTSLGGSLRYKKDNFHIAVNALYNRFDKELLRAPQPYNRFFFNGDRLLNLSADYSYIYRNFNFFGETAISDNGGLATLNGLLIGLDRKVNFSILQRHFEPQYQNLDARAFGETSSTNNETGVYLGFQINPNRNWVFQAYYDMWKHPYLRFRVDAPSVGHEYLLKITYKQKRKMETYAQFRFERKQQNAPDPEAPIDYLIERDLIRLRLHLTYHVNKVITLKSRAEFSYLNDNFNPNSRGYLVYQDLIYKPKGIPFSLNTRYALYDTDNFDTRIFAYENSLLNEFINPSYYNQGSRFYLNFRYTGVRNLSLELRYARTFWERPETIGTGLEEINGDVRSEIKAQVKYKF